MGEKVVIDEEDFDKKASFFVLSEIEKEKKITKGFDDKIASLKLKAMEEIMRINIGLQSDIKVAINEQARVSYNSVGDIRMVDKKMEVSYDRILDSIPDKLKDKSCKTCKHFVSYQEDYEDPLEPDDCGRCYKEGTPENEDGYTGGNGCRQWEE